MPMTAAMMRAQIRIPFLPLRNSSLNTFMIYPHLHNKKGIYPPDQNRGQIDPECYIEIVFSEPR